MKVNKDKKSIKNKFSIKSELIKKHKLIFWLIIFPPVGIYKSIKYKIMPKLINIFYIVFVLVLSLVCVHSIVNPNGALYSFIETELSKNYSDIGDIYNVYISDDKTNCSVITSNGKYIVTLNKDKEDLTLSNVKEISPVRRNLTNEATDSELFLEIDDFVKNKGASLNLGSIVSIKETISQNIQTISTTTGEYRFHLCDNYITEIYKVSNKEERIFIDEKYSINTPDNILKFIKDANISISKRRNTENILGEYIRTFDYTYDENIECFWIETQNAKIKVTEAKDGTLNLYIDDDN